MTLPYCWTHWFWITFYLSRMVGVDPAPQEAPPPPATDLLPFWLVPGATAIGSETFASAPGDPHFPFARQPQWTHYRENSELELYGSSLFEAATRSLDGMETQNPKTTLETEPPMLGDEPPRLAKPPQTTVQADTSFRRQNSSESIKADPIKKASRAWAKEEAAAAAAVAASVTLSASTVSATTNKSLSEKTSTPLPPVVNQTISARLPKTAPRQREITFGEDYNATHMGLPRNLTLLEEIEAELQASQRQRPQETAAAVAAAEELPSDRQLDAGAIAGIAVGLAATAALIVAASIVLYRRRYLNQPHTLNDKCSNPDSSGYIDDTTLRENSEEMYSLDNDSFLNSLEAMTIQNYWTDSVKHTKL